MQHHKLIDYLERHASEQGMSMTELSRKMGFHENQLGNLARGTIPGLKMCIDMARYLKLKPDYVLYLAGHITEGDLNSPSEIPAELIPLLQQVGQMKGTPFFDTALKIIEDSIDSVIKLFRKVA